MFVLDLHLLNKWYDMIEAGIKPEEYREDKDYWRARLLLPNGEYKPYTHVRFHRGYSKRNMLFRIQSMSFGRGNPAWGAPPYNVHVIRLGARTDANGTEYVTIGESRGWLYHEILML